MSSHVTTGIAYQIQALRSKLGLTQKEFAVLVNKPQSVISRLENTEYGKVSVQTLLDIAVAVDVALSVRFVSYPDFLVQTQDVSPSAYCIDRFAESKWAEIPNKAVVPTQTQPQPKHQNENDKWKKHHPYKQPPQPKDCVQGPKAILTSIPTPPTYESRLSM